MFHGKRIAVVVPAYNEERLLPRTLRSIPDYVDHVIVVDDGSQDDTARSARAAARRVELIRHERNRGVGAALVSGYRAALAAGAEVVAVMAGDAQMDPRDLPALLLPLVQGRADYVKGDRLAYPSGYRYVPWWRLLGGVVLTWMTRITSGHWRLRDSQCGYTAATREALLRLPLGRLYPRYGYPNDLLGWIDAMGLRLHQVPVRPVYGDEDSGIHPLGIIPRLLVVLTRSFALRLWNKYLGRRGPAARPVMPRRRLTRRTRLPARPGALRARRARRVRTAARAPRLDRTFRQQPAAPSVPGPGAPGRWSPPPEASVARGSSR